MQYKLQDTLEVYFLWTFTLLFYTPAICNSLISTKKIGLRSLISHGFYLKTDSRTRKLLKPRPRGDRASKAQPIGPQNSKIVEAKTAPRPEIELWAVSGELQNCKKLLPSVDLGLFGHFLQHMVMGSWGGKNDSVI